MAEDTLVEIETAEGIGTLVLNNPPVNALGLGLRKALLAGIDTLLADKSVRVIVLRGAGRTFPAGADIREFDRPPEDPWLPAICDRIEAARVPVLAALHGTVLGGGLELALAAHYRIALETCRMGLPEVTLGILPGAGGTQRLPRLIGAGPALDMMLSGAPIPAARAHGMGLVDRLVEEDLPRNAQAYALELATQGAKPRPTRARSDGFADPGAYWAAIRKHRDATARAHTSLIAPRKIVACVEAAQMMPFAQGMDLERAHFDDCVVSPQSAALRYQFFADRAAARPPEGAGKAAPLGVIGLVGATRRGCDIALCLVEHGFQVRLVDRSAALLKEGMARIHDSLDRSVARGDFGVRARALQLERLKAGSDLAALAEADLVIETITEDFDLKSELLFKLGQVLPEGKLIASNTTVLDIDGLAQKTGRPEATLGLQFFAPARMTDLVEITPGADTDDAAVAAAFGLVKALGKMPVRSAAEASTLGHCLLRAYLRAATMVLAEGGNPSEIDGALRDFGFPQGPFQMLDFAGLDAAWLTRMADQWAQTSDGAGLDIFQRLRARHWLGQQAGHGFYRYPEGSRIGVDSEEVAAIIDTAREELGITPRQFAPEELVERCVMALVNEGARLVGEQAALRPSDIDVAAVRGLGFPRWEGGPMWLADQMGLTAVLETLDIFSMDAPQFWAPAAILLQFEEDGRTLATLNAS